MTEIDDRLADCRKRLSEFARRRLPRSEREWGSDYVQDALTEAHERAGLIRLLTPEQTYAWLVAVLKRKLANGCRARRQAKRDPRRERSIDSLPAETLASPDASPLEEAERHELAERIDAALERLTDDQRLVLILHIYGGWSMEEIGEQMRVSPQSVQGLICRGLSRLTRNGDFSIADLD
jgi:RNA polymerase sigma-70 factor (ECF subfamily)